MKPRLLDLMCSAGGATRGYQLAGFHVTGVDLELQPHYIGDEFVQADALTFPLEGYNAIHASPPCQRYIRSGMVDHERHPDLLGPIRQRLEQAGIPYVIENVPGAPMRPDVVLCGSMFGLGVRRHRWFETNPILPPWTPACDHNRRITGVYGHPHGRGGAWRNGSRPMLPSDEATWAREMGIDWMTPAELSQALPPAYCEFIGGLLLAHLSRAGATRAADPGPPTSSSPAAPVGAPGGAPSAPALDAQSEPEAAINREVAHDPFQMGQQQGASGSDPHPSHWRPAFIDNDARPVPTTWEPVTVKGGVL